MPNPQTENGYVKIANELFDALISVKLTECERKVFMVVMRKTYGWNKTKDQISLTQIEELTKIDRSNICKSLNSLVARQLLGREKNSQKATSYWIKKDYSKWCMDSGSSATSGSPTTRSSGSPTNKVVAPQPHTKDIKDNIKTIPPKIPPKGEMVSTKKHSTSEKTEAFLKWERKVVMAWNGLAETINALGRTEPLARINAITTKRRKLLKARYKEPVFRHFPNITSAIMTCLEERKGDWLFGLDNRKWTVNFDYIIRSEDCYLKIIEQSGIQTKEGKNELQRNC